jgi:DNA modification methylase
VLDKSNPNGGDSGGASRFFYVAKADSAERSLGLHGQRNPHPTVKPVALMRWLCRLVTPPGGIVLDPFVGSGTTGIAALREGFSFVGIEREAEYVAIARARIIGDAPLLNTHAEAARAHPLGGQ